MKTAILIAMSLFLISCNNINIPSTGDEKNIQSTGSIAQPADAQDTPSSLGEAGENEKQKIYFTQALQHLPDGLPQYCVSYQAGCNACGLNFIDGDFEYSCTELGCPSEPYTCNHALENDYYIVPKLPKDINFPKDYSLGQNCGSIISSHTGELTYYGLMYETTGLKWNSEFQPYHIKQLSKNKDFLQYIDGISLCMADIAGKSLEESPENTKFWKEFQEFKQKQQKEEEETKAKNNILCLSEIDRCNRKFKYYYYNDTQQSADFWQYKFYSRKMASCENKKIKEYCEAEISEFKLKESLKALKIGDFNTEEILRNRQVCFNRIGDIQESCVSYESECESCKIAYDGARKKWRWNFESKGCTQKYIQSQGGLPKMLCNKYTK